MLVYNLDIAEGSLWLRTTPSGFARKQPYYCTEAGIFYAGVNFNTVRDFKDSYLLFYTIEGCGMVVQNNTAVRLLPGQALFINCRSPQSYSTDPQSGIWTHYWAHVDGAGVKAMEELLIPEHKNTPARLGTSVQSRFDVLLKDLENTSSEMILSESLLIHQILTDLVLAAAVSVSGNQKLIMESVDYIRQHCTENVDISTLLEIAHMSKAYYMRLFRQYMGTTPYNYLLSLRITRAKEYLEVTDLTVHEIAMRTGFSDDASFSTRFSAMTGISPLKYRQAAITRRQYPLKHEGTGISSGTV